jgi:hypothetical protein
MMKVLLQSLVRQPLRAPRPAPISLAGRMVSGHFRWRLAAWLP